MGRYALKRLVQGAITVWFIATATFFAMHMVPGDPLASDKAVSEKIRANLEAKYGLDKPLLTQYGIYMANLARGDFGISFTQENRRGERHHPGTLPHLRNTGHSRRGVRGPGRHPVGCADGAQPQPHARHRHHAAGDSRHIGAEFRVRGTRPAHPGQRQQPARFLAFARGPAGARWPTCWCPRWCWAWAPWPTSPG